MMEEHLKNGTKTDSPSPNDKTLQSKVQQEGEKLVPEQNKLDGSALASSLLTDDRPCQKAVYLPAVLFNNCCMHKKDKSPSRKFFLVSSADQTPPCQFCMLCSPQLSSCMPNDCAHRKEILATSTNQKSTDKPPEGETKSVCCGTNSILRNSVSEYTLRYSVIGNKLSEGSREYAEGIHTSSTQTDLCIHPSKLISYSDFESNDDIPNYIGQNYHHFNYNKKMMYNNKVDNRQGSFHWRNTNLSSKKFNGESLNSGKSDGPNDNGTPNSKSTHEKSVNTYTYASEMTKEQKHSPLLQHLQCQLPKSPIVSHRVPSEASTSESKVKKEGDSKDNDKISDKKSCTNGNDSKLTNGSKFYSFPRKNSSNSISQCNSLPHPSKNSLDGSCDHETFSPTRLDDWLHLNVGGQEFVTSRATLILEEPECMLAKMFGGQPSYLPPASQDSKGSYIIDRSPVYFAPILNYLRTGTLVLDPGINPEGVLQEAQFFGIESIVPKLEKMTVKTEDAPLSRRDVVQALLSTSHSTDLRFQAVNLQGADLSWLDLRNINFKYADLRNANLTGTNLSSCNLERAKMSGACLEQAQLFNVRLVCADLQNVNMRQCNFDNPMGGDAPNCEGVNLRNSILEGSMMGKVNLRVSTLKNANLRNCDLTFSVLAGADMENCDLSGSNLLHANLRGANLKDASFELMQTPLHMSQTCDL